MLEVADIFREHGAAWRDANRGHVSLDQMKVMTAIECCRTAALGGHVARCENGACGHTVIAYNSCCNRHCPKCQGAAAREWMEAREAELLPVTYFHVVYTLPSQLRDIAYQNKRVVYDLLMRAAADATITIAADPRHLGAKIGITAVLHTWGSAMTHHPHVHMIVPGGGISDDGARWISSSKSAREKNFFVHVNLLRRLFRGKFLALLAQRTRMAASSSSMPMRVSRTNAPSRSSSVRCVTSNGSCTVRTRSAGPNRCCVISPDIRIVLPSRTAGWSRPTMAACRSAGRTIALRGPSAGKR